MIRGEGKYGGRLTNFNGGMWKKVCWWEQDFLILTEGLQDSFEIKGGMWD